MANNYYTVTYDFEPFTRISSPQVDAEFAAVVSAFDLLPAPTQFDSANLAFVAAGGTADALTVAHPVTTWTTYTGKDGYRINVQITSDNTGAVTLAVDGLAAKSCIRNTGAALEAGDLKASGFYDFIYDEAAGNFKVLVEASSIVNADKLGSVLAANYARTDTAETFSSSVTIQDTKYTAYGSSRTDITGLINGSNFGSLIESDETAHFVIGIRANDTNDSFAIISDSSNDGTYDKLLFRVRDSGEAELGSGSLTLPNAEGIKIEDFSGTSYTILDLDGNDDLNLGSAIGVDNLFVDSSLDQVYRRAGSECFRVQSTGAKTTGDHEVTGDAKLLNTKGIQIKDAGGTYANAISLDSNDNLQIGDDTSVDNIEYRVAASGSYDFYINSTLAFKAHNNGTEVRSGSLVPVPDNTYDLGTGVYRWNDVYATNATIQTSDIRLKDSIEPLTELSLGLINLLKPVSYKWKDYVQEIVEKEAREERIESRPVTQIVEQPKIIHEWQESEQVFVRKEIIEQVEQTVYDEFPLLDELGEAILDKDGEPVVEKRIRMEDVIIPAEPAVIREAEHTYSRTHYGLIAQDVEQALITAGIDPASTGAFIYNEESDMYGVRYNELIAPMIKSIQILSSKNDALEARVAALENA